MIRVLIAEDEIIERKAMNKFIQDTFSQMMVVGEAKNGREAIELAETLNPDIIIVDIKMPGINGLEAIEMIHNENPEIKFMVVSAYDSFDYAKQAMKFGIKDYILKPGKKEEIVKSLLRVKKEIESEKRQLEEKKQSMKLLKERFASKLMYHPVPKDIFQLQADLFPSMKNGCFFVIKSEASFPKEVLKKVMEENSSYSIIVLKEEEMIVICIIASSSIEKSELLFLAKKLSLQVTNKSFIGIGNPVKSLEKMSISYHEAYEAWLQLELDNKVHYGFYQAKEKQEYEENLISRVESAVEKGHQKEAVQSFEGLQIRFTKRKLEDLYMSIRNMLITRNIVLPSVSFSSLQTNQDWHAYLRLCSMKMNEFHQSKGLIEQAKKYINEHFMEVINLKDVADSVNLSTNYFSHIFKQEFGETFVDFLTRIRMQKTKELIEKNTYSLKEISFMVGYKDPNYFSRVFKKYYHVSPKQFQKEIIKK